MKTTIIGLFLIFLGAQVLFAQNETKEFSVAEMEIIQLSKDKWQWMADKNVDTTALDKQEDKGEVKLKIKG